MSFHNRFRSLGASLVDVFTSRMDLAAAELEDLLARFVSILALLLAEVFAAALALLFLGIALVVAVPEPYRWMAALGCAVFCIIGSMACAYAFRRSLREMPEPFSSTREVLHRDAAALRPMRESATQTMDTPRESVETTL